MKVCLSPLNSRGFILGWSQIISELCCLILTPHRIPFDEANTTRDLEDLHVTLSIACLNDPQVGEAQEPRFKWRVSHICLF